MMSGTAAGENNPNASWINGKGVWLSYIVAIVILHLVLLSLPFLSVAATWTLTNVIHSAAMLFLLHIIKGTPWEPVVDQGTVRKLTQWEQIDDGEQLTTTRKFFTIVPIILFFLASFYTKYDSFHFGINFVSLLCILLPKLPQFHKVRLFGINKY